MAETVSQQANGLQTQRRPSDSHTRRLRATSMVLFSCDFHPRNGCRCYFRRDYDIYLQMNIAITSLPSAGHASPYLPYPNETLLTGAATPPPFDNRLERSYLNHNAKKPVSKETSLEG